MNNNIIEGNPTKQFFIEMITRDISIEDAIMDLVDNSIDGAIRINKDSFQGFRIDIVINEKELSSVFMFFFFLLHSSTSTFTRKCEVSVSDST